MLTKRTTSALAILAFAGLLGACGDDGGSSSDDSGSGSGDGEEASEQEVYDASLEFAECMRENGVEIEDPVLDEGGVLQNPPDPEEADEQEIEAAEAECDHIMEAVESAGPDLSPEEVAERRDAALAMAECMRDRGYEDFPDPEVSDDGSVMIGSDEGEEGPIPGPEDPGFEEFEADSEECHAEAGLEGPGGEGDGGRSEGEEDG